MEGYRDLYYDYITLISLDLDENRNKNWIDSVIKLAVIGSPVLEQLRSLQAKGVHLILCSTCLNYYNLSDQVQVGIVGGMIDIIEAQRRASKVITL